MMVFPIELYRKLWKELKIPYHSMILNAIERGQLPESSKQGIISLMDKPGRDLRYIKNWRPLTLLNCDYKIFSKALANQLENVIPYLIHPDQAGFIKGCFIAQNLMDLNSVMMFANDNNLNSVVVAVDFEKAYDCVSWKALEKIMLSFNLGQNFVNFVKVCYQ